VNCKTAALTRSRSYSLVKADDEDALPFQCDHFRRRRPSFNPEGASASVAVTAPTWYLMILQPQAIIDDSGTEPQSRVFVLGGFIASAADWAKFSIDWQTVLDQPPKLSYFKLTEAMSLSAKGQFARHRGWNETKRDSRLIDLAHVIGNTLQSAFMLR
jgi:hypothetical protein